MRPNQYGGCAMMALGTLSPKVIISGIDSTGLRRWCLIHLGSETKKKWTVMAYQSSDSRQSAGTTVKDQHSRYFCAIGHARSPPTIFFEQLISQLITWKAIDNDIVLLGDFNENVYIGRLTCRLAQDVLTSPNLQASHRHPNSSKILEQKCTNQWKFCHFGNQDRKCIYPSPPWWH
jgi:hypothetical protein